MSGYSLVYTMSTSMSETVSLDSHPRLSGRSEDEELDTDLGQFTH